MTLIRNPRIRVIDRLTRKLLRSRVNVFRNRGTRRSAAIRTAIASSGNKKMMEEERAREREREREREKERSGIHAQISKRAGRETETRRMERRERTHFRVSVKEWKIYRAVSGRTLLCGEFVIGGGRARFTPIARDASSRGHARVIRMRVQRESRGGSPLASRGSCRSSVTSRTALAGCLRDRGSIFVSIADRARSAEKKN